MQLYAIRRRNGWKTAEELQAAAEKSGHMETRRWATRSAGSGPTS